MTDSPPNHVLPPASTTKVSLHEQAKGFFAQRRSTGPKARDALKLPESVRELYSQPDEADAIEEDAPHGVSTGTKRYTIAQLIAGIQEARAHKKAVRGGADPDGPEDNTGWDPRDLNPRGAQLAAGIIAQQRRRR